MSKQAIHWRAKQRADAKEGKFIGYCDCKQLAVKIRGADRICARCLELDSKDYARELARGVCGYRRRGVLATSSGRDV